MTDKFWAGDPPKQCDLCRTPLLSHFIDGKTVHGPWVCLCVSCHAFEGYGLGMGRGQKYEKQPDGRWKKTGG